MYYLSSFHKYTQQQANTSDVDDIQFHDLRSCTFTPRWHAAGTHIALETASGGTANMTTSFNVESSKIKTSLQLWYCLELSSRNYVRTVDPHVCRTMRAGGSKTGLWPRVQILRQPPTMTSSIGPYRNALDLAHTAAKSFDGSQPLTESQNSAILRWKEFQAAHMGPGPLRSHHLWHLTSIFSDIFFLGELGCQSVVQVHWERLSWSLLGQCEYFSDNSPSIISLNCQISRLFNRKACAIGVLLHEMVHALLGVRQLDGAQKSHTMFRRRDLGLSGHGRAFMVLVKAIERHMGELLGLSEDLGRLEGRMCELFAFVKTPFEAVRALRPRLLKRMAHRP